MSSTKFVKCINCNIVINEVLSFIQNKLEVMDNESITRICVTSFSVDDIEEAKSLLFDSVKAKRRVCRKSDNKKQKDVADIITLFKDTDPESIPIFVAKDLHKLPPITFDHVDVTRLLKDILILRSEVNEIKNSYITAKELEDLKTEWHHNKYASILNPDLNVNLNVNKRSAYCSADSGPMGLSYEPSADQSRSEIRMCADDVTVTQTQLSLLCANKNAYTPSLLSPSANNNKSTVTNTAPQSASKSAVKFDGIMNKRYDKNSTTENRVTFSEVLSDGHVWKPAHIDEEWKTVQRRRFKNRFVGSFGKAIADPSTNFKSADLKVPLFISNVHKDVSETDIVDYVFNKTGVRVSLSKITMKLEKNYNSYKVFVDKHKLDDFLNDNVWPTGISFRRFVNIKKKKKDNLSSGNLKV